MTQSEPAALDECAPPLLDPLPVVAEELAPDPPGETVVLPLTAPPPAVIVVVLPPELVPGPPPWRVTTRHGLPLTIVVPSELVATDVLAAKAGAALASKPIRTGRAARLMRMVSSVNSAPGRPSDPGEPLPGKRGPGALCADFAGNCDLPARLSPSHFPSTLRPPAPGAE
jgi:hypothetical protein